MQSDWKRFLHEDFGAVTVDWVVLCAALIGMGMLVLRPVAFSADSSAKGVSAYVENVPVGYENN